MKKAIAFLLILPLAAYADSVKGDKFSLTYSSFIACDSVRLKLGFPDTSATPDTVMPAINVLMHHIATSDGENWVYYRPPGFDSLGTLVVDIIYYIAGIGEHVIGAWLNIADTLSMQGAASGLTAAAAAKATADTLQERGFLFVGLGDKDDTLYVLDASDSSAIANITIIVRPDGGGTPFARVITGVSGSKIINLNDGDYDCWLGGQGYVFINPYDLNVLDNESDSIFLTAFAPSPAPANMVNIIAWLKTAAGDSINPSKLRYRPLKPDTTGEIEYIYEGDTSYYREYTDNEKLNYGSGSSQVVIVKKWIEKSYTTSYLPLQLYPNSLLTDTTSVIEFEATYRPPGGRDYIARHVIIAVPNTSAFNPFAQ